MGSNQGSRNSPNSGSFNFRFIHKHARLAAFALMAAILFSPGQSQAYWRTCFPNPANCSTSSAQASCQSYAWFYSSPYYFLTPNRPPDNLYCAVLWFNNQYLHPVWAVCPTGLVPDVNTPSGCAPVAMPGKLIGGGSCNCGAPDSLGNAFGGEPINIASGNMFYSVTDYKTAGQNTLDFTRYYNSRGNALAELGANWRSTYDRFIWLYSSSSVGVQRADGQTLTFTLNGSTWTSDSDVAYTLTNSGSTWILTTPNDTVETYTNASPPSANSAAINAALLNIIQARNGYTQTLTYNASNQQLASVGDSYGRTLTFTYAASGLLQTLGTPDGRTFTYGYTTTTSGQNLTSVTYPTSPASSNIYVYENPNLPNTLTGVIDENGNRYAAWTYDAYGRALTSSLGGSLNANLTTVAYNDTDGSRTVTNALGTTDTYTFAALQGVPKVAQISRAATSTTAAATRTFTYDANGFMASSTDWEGNVTSYTHDARGDETSRVEAAGTALARTISTTWLSALHLPAQITEPNRSTAFSYDAHGNLLAKQITAGALTRSFAYTYNATGEVLTEGDPRGNVTNKPMTPRAILRTSRMRSGM
jgi:YD repeat-containing protein